LIGELERWETRFSAPEYVFGTAPNAFLAKQTMMCRVAGVLLVLTLLSGVAHAGSAPKELYGKSIIVRWSESLTGVTRSEQVPRNVGRADQMDVYVSVTGRPFVRMMETGYAGASHQMEMGGSVGVLSRSAETAPGGSTSRSADRVEFQGRTIVVYREFDSGARRITINVDTATQNCTAAITHGRQAGSKVVSKVGSKGYFDATSIQIGNLSCSIREGNVFGGQ
jgi:hypothetical protein